MKDQNYANHIRLVPGFHFVLGSLFILGSLGSFFNIYFRWAAHDEIMSALLLAVLFVCCTLLYSYTRQFPIKVQDRAIRAEESLRYYIITNKPLDSNLTMAQIIALRFASNDEFVALADRAVRENLSGNEIKKAIKNWRADLYRA
jgi:hypothetical protein